MPGTAVAAGTAPASAIIAADDEAMVTEAGAALDEKLNPTHRRTESITGSIE